MSHPLIESHLPQLMNFVSKLAQEYESGKITSWDTMRRKVFAFFTPEMMKRVEGIAPGWEKMASYSEGLTLLHVNSALAALHICPEFEEATPRQQSLMKWVVLFHDVGKKARPGGRDLTHSFRSAAMSGENLPRLGFPTTPEYSKGIQDWVSLTNSAVIKDKKTGVEIQDNNKLPEIMKGIEALFGHHTPTALVVKTILFHNSITVVEEWPQAAPLTKAEMRQYLDDELFSLLKIMTLVDNDSWSLFNLPKKERHRHETLETFRRIKRIK